MTLHIYRAKDQPATRHVVHIDDACRFTVRPPKHRLLPCFRCKQKRWAMNLIAHVYYDGTYFFCRPGKGCQLAGKRVKGNGG